MNHSVISVYATVPKCEALLALERGRMTLKEYDARYSAQAEDRMEFERRKL
jgi:hypothetical protein